ncbi:MAG: peptide chain release factor N(5)-glutamine methyltransferase [Aliidiomarina sp.]|uniref:peptide chain release factor N(5)-glutamine methyltransferase n=1 Tax=Aliidiomarina sp. TaxID=1872439 RepID=UPI0025BC5A9D|nr:peptide chain release factor N(5)-glutamine methyltransferase [Aliidiomarina sp.]MCH8502092.1 peptide chain release factor N(5)-glutamine methyltransferase [Aliidiomarina sp.]
MQIQALLREATAALAAVGVDTPQLDAQVLLMNVLEVPRSYLYTWPEKSLTAAQLEHFQQLLEQRLSGVPVAYLTGFREFWSMAFAVSESTLIPRPDTEILVETALALLPNEPARVLELGTGTGAIAIALASERPHWQVTAVDVVPAAVALASKNAERLLHEAQRSQFQVMLSDWFSAVENKPRFQLIVSNPPYLASNDPHLEQGDVRFEPRSALVAEHDGLADYERIIAQSGDYLCADGWLLFEHGCEQGAALRQRLADAGFSQIQTWRDYAGLERVTGGQKTLQKRPIKQR